MVSPVGDKFFVEATAGRLFLVCPYIPAISTHYLCFHKPCRGRRPRRPAYGTSQRINNHTLSNAGLEPAFKCSLRLVLTFTLYLCATLVSYANSSLLTETLYSSSFSTDINASCGTDTDPSCLIRFFPSFCFSNSFFFLVISPP